MARVARTARIVATVGAVIATAVLLGIHMELSTAAAGTAIQPVVVAAAVALAISVAALAWTWIPFQSEAEGPSLRRSVAWAAPVLALGALSAWGGRFGGFSLPGRAYLACVALLALLVALASRAMRLREGTGLGLLVAGVISLVLNGALGGTWRPMGAIGEGQANLALELILVGWIILAGIWIAGPSAAPIRGWLGRSLVSVGDRLSPGAAVPETERGSTP